MDKKSTKLLLIIFLVGIFMGSLDTAIVSPARTIMGNTLHISADASIWIITLYTLFYAISMPIIGKLADRKGMKLMFTISVILFGTGSLLCGIADYTSSFSFLLFARAIEAIGAGGILPIATAFIGASFPPEKRGAALGMVGGINGIATLLGPALGSFVLDTFGGSNWGILFFINIPLCIVVLIILFSTKMEALKKAPKKMDIAGSMVSGLFILSLMLFITNLSFLDFWKSFSSTSCYPYLIAAVLLLPILIFVELRAEDPIINMTYFTKKQMVIVFVLAFLVGVGLMVVVFLPQFCSNTLGLKLGSGGYFVTLMAVFTGAAAPFGGKLIDKTSAKLVLTSGFALTIIGSLILAFAVPATLSGIILAIGLAFVGLGIGFTMGTPLNYVIQSSVEQEHVASAQSTLSLIRSIGIALSPNLLVNFIAEAGNKMPAALMKVIPPAPGLSTASMAGGSAGAGMVSAFQNANVTTIFGIVKNFLNNMFDKASPDMLKSMQGHIPPGSSATAMLAQSKAEYFSKLDNARSAIESTYQQTMNNGFAHMFITLAIIAALGVLCTLFLPKIIKKVA